MSQFKNMESISKDLDETEILMLSDSHRPDFSSMAKNQQIILNDCDVNSQSDSSMEDV